VAWIAKVLLCTGYGIASVYTVYMLQSYVTHGAVGDAGGADAPLIQLAGLPAALIGMAVSGRWSDRIGRRKPFVSRRRSSWPCSFRAVRVADRGRAVRPVRRDRARLRRVHRRRPGVFHRLAAAPRGGRPATSACRPSARTSGQAAGPTVAGAVVAIFGGAYGPVWPVGFVLVSSPRSRSPDQARLASTAQKERPRRDRSRIPYQDRGLDVDQTVATCCPDGLADKGRHHVPADGRDRGARRPRDVRRVHRALDAGMLDKRVNHVNILQAPTARDLAEWVNARTGRSRRAATGHPGHRLHDRATRSATTPARNYGWPLLTVAEMLGFGALNDPGNWSSASPTPSAASTSPSAIRLALHPQIRSSRPSHGGVARARPSARTS